MTQLEKLKIQLGAGGTDQDGLLQLLLDDAASDLLSWCNRTVLPIGLESTQRQIAVIRYNMVGLEGQTAHSEGGVSRSFDELPLSVQKTINQYRKLKVTQYAQA